MAPFYYKKGFVIEMEVMKSLKPHPNVIGFLGHVVNSGSISRFLDDDLYIVQFVLIIIIIIIIIKFY